MQEKLLDLKAQALKLDDEFLQSFSAVVGSKWQSLAVSLLLSQSEILGLKEKVGLSQQELALNMLRIWASREGATYGKLCHQLKAISFFQLLRSV